MSKEIVLFSQAGYSPYTALARDVLTRYQVPFREIDAEQDHHRADRIKAWNGQLVLPTLIVATASTDSPFEPPLPPDTLQATKGDDRGSLIVRPNNYQLENWLHKHGFLAKPYRR